MDLHFTHQTSYPPHPLKLLRHICGANTNELKIAAQIGDYLKIVKTILQLRTLFGKRDQILNFGTSFETANAI